VRDLGEPGRLRVDAVEEAPLLGGTVLAVASALVLLLIVNSLKLKQARMMGSAAPNV